MNGPAHYKEAETLIQGARDIGRNALEMKAAAVAEGGSFDSSRAIELILAEAQVHATLALTAATAANIRRNGALSNSGASDPFGWTEAITDERQ
jgi:hypothetical protein